MKSDKFRKLLSANPENDLFRFSFAQALMEEGDEDQAVDLFEHCIRKKPDWMMASILKAKCLLALNRTDDAKRELNRALQLAIDQKHEAPEIEIRKLLTLSSGN